MTFQQTYFCNVRREDDKTTQYIRCMYAECFDDPWLIYNLILARFINRIESLRHFPFLNHDDPNGMVDFLEEVAHIEGQLWSGAYIITTHGLPMGKVQYLVNHVLQGASGLAGRVGTRGQLQGWLPTCAAYHAGLMQLEGLGSFLAAQIVADLKNTKGHILNDAEDFQTFVAHGPGSLRGASWFHYGHSDGVRPNLFPIRFQEIRNYVDDNWNIELLEICNQDLQNCLCEFDKYMRVSTGVGRSKRKYDGLNNGAEHT